jgi:tetratricopeptide (TPR) repeat protein
VEQKILIIFASSIPIFSILAKEVEETNFYFSSVVVGIFVTISGLWFLLKKKTIEIIAFDLIIFAVLIYAVALQYYQHQCIWNIVFFKNIFLTCIMFVICRNIFNNQIKFSLNSIIYCLIIINIINYYKIIDHISHNKDFLLYINETFGSSGIYAIFLAFTYVLCYRQILNGRNLKYEKIVFLLIGIVNIYLSIILKSRTALLIILFFSIMPFIQNRFKCLKGKIYTVTFAFFIIIIIGISILYKGQSSEGRLLILKISTNILHDYFPLGSGLNTFPSIYPQYQASFHQKGNMSESEILRADSTSFAFNEPIQMACELGFVGVLLTGIVFGKILMENGKKKKNVKAAMLSILFASMFYYVFHSTLIVLFFVLCLSFLFSGEKPILYIPLPVNWIFLPMLLIGALSISFSNLSKYSSVKTLNILLTLNNNDMSRYRNLEDKLEDNRYFLYHYALKLYRNDMFQESLEKLLLLDKYAIRYESEILKGDAYAECNEITNAEKYYINAINICPGKFNARYKLLNLYKEVQEKEKALNVASGIIKLPEKVPSAVTLAIKMEAESYIHKNKNQ